MPFAAGQQRTKIPVTIITGFLGAGKTSLLNHLLKERGSKSIAVVENEFGEVNIDRELVAENLVEKEDLVSLENGCVCCSLRKDIVKAFAEIERRSRGRDKPIDAIIMETTGLADPAPVAFTFFANPWVASRFKLDSIMCVVDARYLRQHLEDAAHFEGAINEAINQIAFSDLILLNKIDLVTPKEKAEVLATVKKINSTARVLECQLNDPSGRPKFDNLLGINSFSIERTLELDPNFLASDSEDEDNLVDSTNNHHTVPSPTSRSAATAATAATAAGPRVESCAAEEHVEHAHTHKGAHAGHKHSLHEEEDRKSFDSENLNSNERQPKRQRKKLHDLSDVSSVAMTARGPMDEYRFNMYMRDLLSEKAKDIFRCKGVLCVQGYGSQKFVFQGVHDTICYGPCGDTWKEGETKLNQIVFIGRGLDRKALIEGFRTCIWVPLPEGWQEFKDPQTKQPYYFNQLTGVKSWSRPEAIASAHVTATHTSIEQPLSRIPRKQAAS